MELENPNTLVNSHNSLGNSDRRGKLGLVFSDERNVALPLDDVQILIENQSESCKFRRI